MEGLLAPLQGTGLGLVTETGFLGDRSSAIAKVAGPLDATVGNHLLKRDQDGDKATTAREWPEGLPNHCTESLGCISRLHCMALCR